MAVAEKRFKMWASSKTNRPEPVMKTAVPSSLSSLASVRSTPKVLKESTISAVLENSVKMEALRLQLEEVTVKRVKVLKMVTARKQFLQRARRT